MVAARQYMQVVRCRAGADPQQVESSVRVAADHLPGELSWVAVPWSPPRRGWWHPRRAPHVLVAVSVNTYSREAFMHAADGIYGALAGDGFDPVVIDPYRPSEEYSAARDLWSSAST